MFPSSLSLCSHCRRRNVWDPIRLFVVAERNLHHTASVNRQPQNSNSKTPTPRDRLNSHGLHPIRNPRRNPLQKSDSPRRITLDGARDILTEDLEHWAKAQSTLKRLKIMNVGAADSRMVLQAFVNNQPAYRGGYFPPEEDALWQLERVTEEMKENRRQATDRALTRRFMEWVSTAGTAIPDHIRKPLVAIREAADMRYPAEWYPRARAIRRKIIMHVGPTNSGKTHNALRTLAAARTGVYAGPLRLLAHEIYDRLNKGQIVPLGADPNDPPEKHARECNMITGEEQKIISPDTKLVSCTVEMLSPYSSWDVAVVDEIQMIADPERGGAWTSAVLGLCAQEVHLCGEDSVVPLVQEMLKDTGDELIINRYERLTPLVVAPRSLNGDFGQIQPGDCVVAFSRSRIFSLKKAIESQSGMRCAVAYGRLPPEVRSEQAALFNDPSSGYDVLVGSDALGMGLNLKIKRIIFEAVHKWDGTRERLLSLSQLKQIAGRAGRFGLHADDSAGGIATTLNEPDLPILRKAVNSAFSTAARRAILPMTPECHSAIEQVITAPVKLADVFDIQNFVSVIRPCYALTDIPKIGDAATFIDKHCADFSLAERLMLLDAPVPWRDSTATEAMVRFLRMYRDKQTVDLRKALRGLGLTEALDDVHETQSLGGPPSASAETLGRLESLYKIVVVYLWISFRSPLAFNQREASTEMKEQTEKAIDWCLEGLQTKKKRVPTVARATRAKKDPAFAIESHSWGSGQQLIEL